MKKLAMMVLGAVAVLAVFANCGRNDNNPGGPTGMSAACYYQQTSAQGNYAYGYMNQPGTPCNYNYAALSAQGFSQANTGAGFYQTSMMMGAGICPNGAQAVVYSPSKGVGCVDSTRLYLSGQVATYALSQATMTFVPSSAPSPYYQSQPYGYGGAGYPGALGYGNGFAGNGMMTVLRVCDGVELCPSGQFCRSPVGPTSYNTGVGVCYF